MYLEPHCPPTPQSCCTILVSKGAFPLQEFLGILGTLQELFLSLLPSPLLSRAPRRRLPWLRNSCAAVSKVG